MACKTMDLELSDAEVKQMTNDNDEEEYSVIAHDARFGARLVIANFVFDNTHENGFYKERAYFMAQMMANIINS